MFFSYMFLRERGKPIAESQVESLSTHDGRMQKKFANPLLKAISPEVLCRQADSESVLSVQQSLSACVTSHHALRSLWSAVPL